MNLGARLVGAAGSGEAVFSDAIWPQISGELAAEPRTLRLKGVEAPTHAHVVRVASRPHA